MNAFARTISNLQPYPPGHDCFHKLDWPLSLSSQLVSSCDRSPSTAALGKQLSDSCSRLLHNYRRESRDTQSPAISLKLMHCQQASGKRLELEVAITTNGSCSFAAYLNLLESLTYITIMCEERT